MLTLGPWITAARADVFAEKIAPLLEAKCIACHRPEIRKGEFDLSTREGMLRGGADGAGLVPGHPDESPVYFRTISHDGKKPEMPKKGDALTPEEAATFRAWIQSGAAWPDGRVLKEKAKADRSFWSFRSLAHSAPPEATGVPDSWRINPIDRFVFAKLREHQLAPNPPADARSFIRRATYDLTGLPPTPGEISDFEKETIRHPQTAVPGLIDRLLASPRYGEQWGRHWLDVIRFGESRGYERNLIITNLWPFRDYVIRSFNEDKPFDRIIQEHVAGDVIGKDQPGIEVGSAFLVAGPYDDVKNQNPVARAQIRADELDEMIRATGEAFLGMTIGCARCHDHKFDPLTQRDYYSLYAIFAGTTHGEREVATPSERQARREKLKPLERSRAAIAMERDALQKELEQRAREREPELLTTWTRPKLSRYGTEEEFPTVTARQVRLVIEGTDGSDPDKDLARIDEFEVWTDEAAPRNVALAANGGRATGEAREARDFAEAYDPAITIDGKFGERWFGLGRKLVIAFAKPESIRRIVFSSDRNRALPENSGISMFVGEYHIDVSNDGATWTTVADSHDRLPPTNGIRRLRLLTAVTTPEEKSKFTALRDETDRIDAEIARIPATSTWWVGNHFAAAGPFHTFIGGSPQREGAEVKPASLSVLAGASSDFELSASVPEQNRRLALAHWLTAPDNPLTPRVLANRLWHYHFGSGIVDTPSDFGFMGSRPTHPELLDWLAGELQRSGWSMKSMHRLIMTSQTYRQSAAWRADAAREDGDSRWFWRFPPRRLSAEELRDTMLFDSGKLNQTMGGPGFRLYDYAQDNVATYTPLDVHGPETYRRAVYHQNARAARVDLMTEFDCPDPSFAEPRRASTTTPLQALTLLNHRFSIDMAAAFAVRLDAEPNPDRMVERAFAIAFGRPPEPDETAAAIRLISEHGVRAFCRALLNSGEFITVN
jgi:hypothetical protein